MDTLTHALSGALVARGTARRELQGPDLRRRLAAGFLAAASPDLDFVVGYFGPLAYLEHHRGVTHSLILLPFWALLLSWLLALILRDKRGWRALYGITALALAVHIAGDVITSFGTVVFAPFSDWRAALGTTFIIDLIFTGIIVVGLLFSWWRSKSRWPAIIASITLVSYIGFQYFQQQLAREVGERYATSLNLRDARVTVQPRPVSPYNWSVFVSDDSAHHFAHINLQRSQPRPANPDPNFFERLDSFYEPANQLKWTTRLRYGPEPEASIVQSAWSAPAMATYRWFTELPAFDGADADQRCVWFVDLRFATPGMDRLPFRYGACRGSTDRTATGTWTFATPPPGQP